MVTEVSADAQGAVFLYPSARTVIDVGAEEGRGIKTTAAGKVVDFPATAKSAAGAGAFTESMARALEAASVHMEWASTLELQTRDLVSHSEALRSRATMLRWMLGGQERRQTGSIAQEAGSLLDLAREYHTGVALTEAQRRIAEIERRWEPEPGPHAEVEARAREAYRDLAETIRAALVAIATRVVDSRPDIGTAHPNQNRGRPANDGAVG